MNFFIERKNKRIKQTWLNNYGTENLMEIDFIREKIKQTNLEKYGCECSFESEEVKEKIKQTMKRKYGEDYYLQTEEGKEKQKKTFLERYNVDNPMKIKESKEKAKKTNKTKYGVEYISQSKDIKEKIIKTNLRKYGVKYTLSSSEIRKKGKLTSISKYGVENPAQSPLIQEKIKRTLFKYGKTRTSKQQKQLYDIIKQEYENSFLNYPEKQYSLDCAILLSDIKIDIEYDGWYWHTINDMANKDKERDKIIIGLGYKVLRIKGGRNIPLKGNLLESIQELINSKENYKEIILPEWEEHILKNIT